MDTHASKSACQLLLTKEHLPFYLEQKQWTFLFTLSFTIYEKGILLECYNFFRPTPYLMFSLASYQLARDSNLTWQHQLLLLNRGFDSKINNDVQTHRKVFTWYQDLINGEIEPLKVSDKASPFAQEGRTHKTITEIHCQPIQHLSSPFIKSQSLFLSCFQKHCLPYTNSLKLCNF